MQHIYDTQPRDGLGRRAADLMSQVKRAVEIEKSESFFARLFDTRRVVWARARRRHLVNKLVEVFDLPPGGAVRVPREWIS